MTSQKDKGINSISYNYLDLPEEIKFSATYIIRNKVTGEDEERNVRTNYVYRADGSKLRKEYTVFFNKGGSERTTTTDYLDGFQYTVNHLGTVTLEFVATPEGYYDFKNNRYIYNYVDHLGNTRLSYFKNAGGSAEVLEENNYYPFGLKHEGYNALAGNPSFQYQYNGKELQEETGWYDYGARMYMSDIARWGVMDPLAEQYRAWSPYNYAVNNPVSFIDPDGRLTYDWQLGAYRDGKGELMGWSMNNWGDSSFGKGSTNDTVDRSAEIMSFISNALGTGAGLADGELSPWMSNYITELNYGGQIKPIVQILIWPLDGDVGHTALRVNGAVYGYYPTDIDGDGRYTKVDLKNSPGEMHIDSENEFYQKYYGNTIVSYTIRMSDSQVKGLEKTLLGFAKNPGMYELTGLNCTSVAIQALTKNGVNIFTSPTTYSRFDGEATSYKLKTGYYVSPDRLLKYLNNGLNNYSFYNRNQYTIK